MKLTIVLIMSLTVSQAFAQGVKVKKAWESAEKSVNDALQDLNKKCGGSTKVDWDRKSYGSDEDMINTAGWCSNTVNALAGLCDDADYKEAMKGIKVINCKYDAGIKKDDTTYGNKFELKNGTFTHMYNKDTANMGDKARAFAKDNL